MSEETKNVTVSPDANRITSENPESDANHISNEPPPRVITINGMNWSAVPGVKYQYNYYKVIDFILSGDPEWGEINTYRNLMLNDLWFLVYFGLQVPIANHKWWVDCCRDIEEGPQTETIDLWARDHGKAVDCNYPVLTNDGWKPHGDLVVGDLVFHPSGKQTKVIAVSEIFTDTDCYEVEFRDGSKVTCSGNHLWEVWKKSRKRIPGTRNSRQYRDKSVLDTRQLSEWSHLPDKRHTVPLNEPLDFGKLDPLLIEPYTLGAWLGDGTSSCSTITSADQEIVDRISLDGYEIYKTAAKYRYNIKMLRPKLRELGVLDNKHIPDQYLTASIESRRNLLQGLMDTDGTMDHVGTASFSNINKGLAEQVYFLCHSLGLAPRLVIREKTYNEKPYVFYEVRFRAYKKDKVFHLTRKQEKTKDTSRTYRGKFISSVKAVPSIPTRCIQVDAEDGLYLIGRDLITTHNSTIITTAETIQQILKYPNESTCILSYTKDTAKAFFQPIKLHFESNPFLQACFPDVLYQNIKDSPQWSDQGIIVRRNNKVKECTLEAWGLTDGMPTGRHFDRLIYDDIVTSDMASSLTIMDRVRHNFSMSRNIGKDGTRSRVIGTPYHHEDVLAHLQALTWPDGPKKGEPVYYVRKKPATDDGTSTGNPVWLSKSRLELLKLDKRVFNTQYLLDPTPMEDEVLPWECVHHVQLKDVPANCIKLMTVDPTGGVRSDGREADSWGILVVAVDPYIEDVGSSKVFILDGCILPMRFDEGINKVVEIYLRNGWIHKLGVEKVGMQTAEMHVSNALRAKGRFVTEDNGMMQVLRPGKGRKVERIESFIGPPLRHGLVHIVDTCPAQVKERLRNEMEKFPLWNKDDGLDALAYVFDLLKNYKLPLSSVKGYKEEKVESVWDKYDRMRSRDTENNELSWMKN
jgi:hypothetical protein